MKAKKIDKEFLITDSNVNCYGFRLLTEGYLIDEYKKNPIGYHMHYRDDGVVVRWEDLRIDGDKVYGKPVVNLSNERGQQTVDEIENKFLNGASVGHIVALEFSEDPAMMLPGQYGPTITKWFNRECSLVDIPGNFNSLALYDKDGNEIKLADFKTNNSFNMKQIILTAAQLALIPNLKANPEQNDIDQAFNDLIAKSQKVDALQGQVNNLTSEVGTLKVENANLKSAGSEKEVTDMLEVALNKDKKITKETSDLFAVQYKGKPVELKAVLATMQPIGGVVKNLNATGGGANLQKFEGKTWDELDEAGLLPALKAASTDAFFDKFKDEFGKKHQDDTRV